MTVRVADYLMSRLAEAGIDHVFFLPGGGAMHLNDALACEKRIAPIPCHHEQACGIAAEAYGRVSGRFGVAMVTTGPGATNVVTPVAGAWIESLPLLVISGQVKRTDRLAGRPLRQGGVQEVDIVPMVKSITKYAVTIEEPASIRYHLERAVYEMQSGRPGPVWLDIPLDVQASHVDPDSLEGYEPKSLQESDSNKTIDCILEFLTTSKRPLLLAGHGVRLAGAQSDFLALAEQLQIPVVTTWNGLDLIPWDHPLCVGRPGVVALRAANFAVQNCDLLISIGCRLDNIITAYNPKGFARAARKVIVDVDPNEIAKLDMDIAIGIAQDAGSFIQAFSCRAEELKTCNIQSWRERCANWKLTYGVNHGAEFPSNGPISHYHFVSALADAIPSDTLVSTGSSGLAIEAFYTIFRNKPNQRVFLTSGLGAMGYGLPAAIGACLANGRSPMVAIESDGSLQLNLQEFATLKSQELPICLLIMNNGGYCSIRNTQRNYFEGRYLGTGPEAGLWMPDLARLAAAYELPYIQISDASELQVELPRALAQPRPCLVDVRLVANEVLQPKVAALPQPDGSMLSMPLEDMSPLLSLQELSSNMEIPLASASRQAREAQ